MEVNILSGLYILVHQMQNKNKLGFCSNWLLVFSIYPDPEITPFLQLYIQTNVKQGLKPITYI